MSVQPSHGGIDEGRAMFDYTALLGEMIERGRGDPHLVTAYARFLRELGCPEERIKEARRAALAVNPKLRIEEESAFQQDEFIVKAGAR